MAFGNLLQWLQETPYLPAHSLFWKIKLLPIRQLLVLTFWSQHPFSWDPSATSSSSLYHVLSSQGTWSPSGQAHEAALLCPWPEQPWNGSLQKSPMAWGGKAFLLLVHSAGLVLSLPKWCLLWGLCTSTIAYQQTEQRTISNVPPLRILTSQGRIGCICSCLTFPPFLFIPEGNVDYLPYFAVYTAHPCFWPKLSGKEMFHFNFLNSIIYLFIFRNKMDYHFPRYYFAYRYQYCFLELHF